MGLYFGIWMVVINVFTFGLFGADKRKATRRQWRIPERVLLTAAFIGGALGAALAMRLFHHKTRKPKFSYGVPCILLLHVALAVLFVWHVR